MLIIIAIWYDNENDDDNEDDENDNDDSLTTRTESTTIFPPLYSLKIRTVTLRYSAFEINFEISLTTDKGKKLEETKQKWLCLN